MDSNCPLPYLDFNKFCEYQSDLLLKETDAFFNHHNLRLRKYLLPVKLPDWATNFGEVLDKGEEYEPLTTIYRHKHFLKCRILHNYSYIETKWNRTEDLRNKNIPFDLRPLTSEILNQLDIINEDMMDPEFSGLLVTLNTQAYGTKSEGRESDNELNGTNMSNGTEIKGWGEPIVKREEKLDNEEDKSSEDECEKKATQVNGAGPEESVNKKEGKISKVIAGALVECLITNERCIKSIWLHPDLTKHSTRIILQSFLPRLMHEIFQLPSVITEKGVSKYNKFTYIMHNDLDMFPRQCWLLLASNKKMSLPRHYEPSTFEEHPVQLEYGDCHTDEVGYLFSKHGQPKLSTRVTRNNMSSVDRTSYNMRETRSNSQDEHEVESEEDDITLEKTKLIKLMGNYQSARSFDHGNLLFVKKETNDDFYEDSEEEEESEEDEDEEEDYEEEVKKSKKKKKSKRAYTNLQKSGNANHLSKNTKGSQNKKVNKEHEKNKGDKQKNKQEKTGKEDREKEKDKDKEKERLTKLMSSDNKLRQLKELFLQVGSVTSTRDVSCTCRKEKLTKSIDDQAWLDRLVGCTENYMYLMLPKRSERSRLGLLVREGWRDLVTPDPDPALLQELNNMLPEHARTELVNVKNHNLNYNADVEEWCRLRREDLIDVTSDTEVYMRLPENCN